MSSMSSLFSSYHVCLARDNIRIVDGSSSSIVGKDDIIASSSMHFFFSFSRPKFFFNFLVCQSYH